MRARIILACEKHANAEVARRMNTTRVTVGKWRSRFVEMRTDGLLDDPRPGAPRKITDEAIEALLTRTLESTPRDATHWSPRSRSKRPASAAAA